MLFGFILWGTNKFSIVFSPQCKTYIAPILGPKPTCGALIASKVVFCFWRDVNCHDTGVEYVFHLCVLCVSFSRFKSNMNYTFPLSTFPVF